MNQRSSFELLGSRSASAAVGVLLAISNANATTYTWDGNDSASGPDGGGGTWIADGSTINWWNGATNVFWPTSGTDNDAVFANTAGNVLVDAAGVTVNDITFSTTGYVIQSGGGSVTLNGTTSVLSTASGVTASIDAVLAGSTSLTKSGTGTLVLGGNNTTLTGAIALSQGTLSVTHSSALGASSNTLVLGDSNTGANAVEFKVETGRPAGTSAINLASISNSNFGTSQTITINAGSGLSVNAAALTTTLNLNSSGAVTLKATNTSPNGHGTAQDVNWRIVGNGIAAGTTALTLDGTAQSLRTSQLSDTSAASNFTGDVVIKGTVTTQGRTYLPSGNIAANQNLGFLNNDVTVESGTWNIVWGGETTGALKGAGTILMNCQSALNNIGLTFGNNNRSGNLTGNITSSGGWGITKVGNGTQTLSGSANSYSGVTNVNAGTLLVNGAKTGSGAVNVASGATLGGTGTVAGALSVTGVLAPGASIESLGTGAVAFANGSTFAYELNSAGLNGDLVDSSGTLTLTGTVNLTLTELASGVLANGSKLTLINYVGASAGAAWTSGLFTYGGNTVADDSVITVGSNQWLFNYNDTVAGSNFSSEQAGNNNFVTMTVVPEPSVALLGGLGVLTLLRRRRNG